MTSPSTDLDGYVGLVVYELTEFINLAVWLVAPWRPTAVADKTFRNAILEAELVHARCLLEFLLNKHNHNDSVIAGHLAPNWAPQNRTLLESDYRRVCAHLSHLSKSRLRGHPTWDIVNIVDSILSPMENLAAQLQDAPYEVAFATATHNARQTYSQRIAPRPSGERTSLTTTSSLSTITGSTGVPPEVR